jgi:hypothetical protein
VPEQVINALRATIAGSASTPNCYPRASWTSSRREQSPANPRARTGTRRLSVLKLRVISRRSELR